MEEQQLVEVLVAILACTERHARSVYMYHVDREGPGFLVFGGDDGEGRPGLMFFESGWTD